MQLDQKDSFLADVLPKFLVRLTEDRKIWSNEKTEIIFQRLSKWNCVLTKDSIEAAMYHVW